MCIHVQWDVRQALDLGFELQIPEVGGECITTAKLCKFQSRLYSCFVDYIVLKFFAKNGTLVYEQIM